MSPKLNVGIIGRDLSKKGGGSKTFLENILYYFGSLNPNNLEFFLIHNNQNLENHFRSFNNTYINIKNPLLFDHLYVSPWAKKNKIDVLLSFKNVMPYRIEAKKIVVILDLAYFIPKYKAYTLIDQIYMKRMIRSSCSRADWVVAISTNTKKDIITYLKIPGSKIKVIYLAANARYKPISDKEILRKTKKKYGLHNEFILHTGGITPRKNLIRLIQAFNDLSNEIPHDLVITGGRGWKNKKEMKMIEANERIRRLGYVPEDDLPLLYNLADCYIYPSLYEGFGLPILEAQACGCPVICSNVSSIPEVGGDSVLYVDPYSVSEIEEKLRILISDESLRNKLINKGFNNVKRFSWEKSATDLLTLIGELQNE